MGNKTYLSKLIGLTGFLLLVATIVIGGEKRTLTTYFVDEFDNFVVGENVLNGGKIYKGIFSHHQPVPYLFSTVVQKITKPNTIWMLVKRNREALMLWAIVWWFVLAINYGGGVVLAGLVYEWIKFEYLGNLVLAQSLVVYPLLYSFLWWQSPRNSVGTRLLLGIALGSVIWTLAPMWLVCLFLGLLALSRYRNNVTSLLVIIIGGLIVTIPILFFIDISGFIESMKINQQYYIPQYHPNFWSEALSSGFVTSVKLFGAEYQNQALGGLVKILGVGFWLISLANLRKNRLRLVFFWLIFLALLNVRSNDIGKIGYDGFYLLSWLVVLIYIVSIPL